MEIRVEELMKFLFHHVNIQIPRLREGFWEFSSGSSEGRYYHLVATLKTALRENNSLSILQSCRCRLIIRERSRSAEEDAAPEVRLNFAPHSGKQLLFRNRER